MMRAFAIPVLAVCFLFLEPSPAYPVEVYVACSDDSVKQAARSQELQSLYAADQADRKGPYPADLQERDRQRRARVGEIFGEGCILTAKDYLAAALVFQHGDRPDHFFQTFLFSMRGAELGDAKQKRTMALGLDRYLVKTNRKQLFASQASKQNSDPCWCLEPVEKSFPERLRQEYMNASLKDQLAWVDTLNEGASCKPAKECTHSLAETPKGSIPGFW